jgi:hypothetical protein
MDAEMSLLMANQALVSMVALFEFLRSAPTG